MNFYNYDNDLSISEEFNKGYENGWNDAWHGKKAVYPKGKTPDEINIEIEKDYWGEITGDRDYGEFDYATGYECGYSDYYERNKEEDDDDSPWMFEEDDYPYDERNNYEPDVYENDW